MSDLPFSYVGARSCNATCWRLRRAAASSQAAPSQASPRPPQALLSWPSSPPSYTAKWVSLRAYKGSSSSLLSLPPLNVNTFRRKKKEAATEKKLIFEACGFLLLFWKRFEPFSLVFQHLLYFSYMPAVSALWSVTQVSGQPLFFL